MYRIDDANFGGAKTSTPVTPKNDDNSYEASHLVAENVESNPVTLMSNGDVATGAMIAGSVIMISNPIVLSLVIVGLLKLNAESTATDNGGDVMADAYDDKEVVHNAGL